MLRFSITAPVGKGIRRVSENCRSPLSCSCSRKVFVAAVANGQRGKQEEVANALASGEATVIST
jgi:hypothetical protein